MAVRSLRPEARLCEDARARASAELDGELDDEVGARALRVHVASCPECARYVTEMRALTSLLRQAPLEPVPGGLAPGRVTTTPCDRARNVARRERRQAATGLCRAATPTSLLRCY